MALSKDLRDEVVFLGERALQPEGMTLPAISKGKWVNPGQLAWRGMKPHGVGVGGSVLHHTEEDRTFLTGDGEFLRDKQGRECRFIPVSSCTSFVIKLLTLYFNSLFPCLLSCTRLSASLCLGPYFLVHCYFRSVWPKVRYSGNVFLDWRFYRRIALAEQWRTNWREITPKYWENRPLVFTL